MEFWLLGPLEVRRDGQPVELRGSKRRALLALLILHANEVVRTDRLVDELWGERPPGNAAAALQNHVSRLRKDLGGDVLATKPWGYVLRADPETIDLARFERLVAEARPLAAKERRAKLAEALALWRGPALTDVASEPALVAEIARLEELRLVALEQRIDTDLELGGTPDLVPELETLVSRHPLRERLRGQLILALYRAGRQAEALETYRETRRVLIDELGIEPSPELRELERAILRQDPALAVAPVAAIPTTGAEPPGWQWPRSPVVAGAVVLLLGAGGAAAALVARSGSPGEAGASPPSTSSPAQPTAPGTTDAGHPIVVTTTTSKHERPGQPQKRGRSGSGSTTTATTASTTTNRRPEPPPPARPATTTTRTEPTTTTETTPRKPADRDWVYWLTDDFNDPVFDNLTWHFAVADGSGGVSAVERNDRVEFSVDPQGVPPSGRLDGHYGTQCTFGKDFDAQIEFQLLTWPPRNGLTVFLAPWFQGATIWTYVGRKGAPPNGPEPERYSTNVYGYVPPEVPTADSRGALRAKRVGKYITTYYRAHGTWIQLGRAHAAGLVRLLFGVVDDGTFGGQPTVVAFDNFQATAPDEQYSVECQGVPYPPRRPPP